MMPDELKIKLITAPAVEVITLQQAKNHLRVDLSDDNEIIIHNAAAARQWLETVTRRAFITQTWDLYLDEWPPGAIRIPRPPLQSITDVFYTDDNGTETAVDNSTYLVDVISTPGRVALKSGQTWPTGTLQAVNGIRVRFVAGYGSDPSDVPAALISATLLLLGDLYENRENTLISIGATFGELPMAIKRLISPYRNWRWK